MVILENMVSIKGPYSYMKSCNPYNELIWKTLKSLQEHKMFFCMATNFHIWKHFMVCMSGQPGSSGFFGNVRSYSSSFSIILHLIPVVFPVIPHFVVATGGPPLATTKCVMATGGAAMGSAVATGGLPWVVSTGKF